MDHRMLPLHQRLDGAVGAMLEALHRWHLHHPRRQDASMMPMIVAHAKAETPTLMDLLERPHPAMTAHARCVQRDCVAQVRAAAGTLHGAVCAYTDGLWALPVLAHSSLRPHLSLQTPSAATTPVLHVLNRPSQAESYGAAASTPASIPYNGPQFADLMARLAALTPAQAAGLHDASLLPVWAITPARGAAVCVRADTPAHALLFAAATCNISLWTGRPSITPHPSGPLPPQPAAPPDVRR